MTTTARRTPALMLLLVAALFALPVLASVGLYLSGWRPSQYGNHGELIAPPRALPAGGLNGNTTGGVSATRQQGVWLLVFPASAACDGPCAAALGDMTRVHRALGKNQGRLRRVLLRTDAGSPAPAALPPETLVYSAPDQAWRDVFRPSDRAVFLVDPFGNVVMRYAIPLDSTGVLRDIERLMKYSWIS